MLFRLPVVKEKQVSRNPSTSIKTLINLLGTLTRDAVRNGERWLVIKLAETSRRK